MSDPSNERLRRLFAAAPVMGPDESFVAALSEGMALRRRRRKAGLIAIWLAAVLVMSVLLAPFAPVNEAIAAGLSLMKMPEVAVSAVGSRAADIYAGVQLPSYLYIVLLACILPLAGAAWLVRRVYGMRLIAAFRE